MISLKRFLSADTDAVRALLHAVRVLIQGIGKHGAVGDPASCRSFRQSIDHVSETIEGEITGDELLVHVGAVVRALEDHRNDFERCRGEHDSELQTMVTMLTSTVAAISAAGAANAESLCDIEKQILSTSELHDVRQIKSRLGECLQTIRREAERQQQETNETIERLRQALPPVENGASHPTPADIDRVTGLPLRSAAEAALCDASQGTPQAFAIVLVLDRLHALNLRFGRAVGDQILCVFAETLQRKLPGGDRLYRWGGPALIVISRAVNIEQARGNISRIVDVPLEHNIETASRSILVPIAARWAVFPMMAAPRLLYKRIDTFASVMTRE
jgi:diguanylate cyclase (GGDEF)-like protein